MEVKRNLGEEICGCPHGVLADFCQNKILEQGVRRMRLGRNCLFALMPREGGEAAPSKPGDEELNKR